MINFSFAKNMLPLLGSLLMGCAATLPPSPTPDPSDPQAPIATSPPLRPTLLATSHNFLSPAAGGREEAARKRNMPEMNGSSMDQMQHEMKGMGKMSMETPAPNQSATSYTCPMHPQIHETQPGNCPICHMTLTQEPAAPDGAKP